MGSQLSLILANGVRVDTTKANNVVMIYGWHHQNLNSTKNTFRHVEYPLIDTVYKEYHKLSFIKSGILKTNFHWTIPELQFSPSI